MREWYAPSMANHVPASSTARLLRQASFSTYCWTASFAWMLGTSLSSVVSYPFLSPAAQSRRSASLFKRVLSFTRSELTVAYAPAFDAERPSVFCFNHVNVLDAHTACATIPQPFVGLMLAWHFRIPGYGWMMRATHGIPVHPGSGRTEALVREARDRLEKGLSILVFPEAHRTLDGTVGPYKRGMFFLARDGGMPVVPVAVRGMFEVNRKGSLLIHPGHVDVFVGPQLETSGLSDDEVTALAVATQRAVADYVEGRDRDGAGMRSLGVASGTA